MILYFLTWVFIDKTAQKEEWWGGEKRKAAFSLGRHRDLRTETAENPLSLATEQGMLDSGP